MGEAEVEGVAGALGEAPRPLPRPLPRPSVLWRLLISWRTFRIFSIDSEKEKKNFLQSNCRM